MAKGRCIFLLRGLQGGAGAPPESANATVAAVPHPSAGAAAVPCPSVPVQVPSSSERPQKVTKVAAVPLPPWPEQGPATVSGLPLALKASFLMADGSENATHVSPVPLGPQLGQGSFGRVCSAKIGDQDVAVKVFDWCLATSAMLEVTVSTSLPPHPNVLRLLDVATTQADIRLVYPLYDMTLLSWYRAAYKEGGGVQEEAYQFLFWKLLCGVEHLHRHAVLHRDIKPQNILVRCPATVSRALAGKGAFLDDAGWGQDRGRGGQHGRKCWRLFCLVSGCGGLVVTTHNATAWSCEVCVCVCVCEVCVTVGGLRGLRVRVRLRLRGLRLCLRQGDAAHACNASTSPGQRRRRSGGLVASIVERVHRVPWRPWQRCARGPGLEASAVPGARTVGGDLVVSCPGDLLGRCLL